MSQAILNRHISNLNPWNLCRLVQDRVGWKIGFWQGASGGVYYRVPFFCPAIFVSAPMSWSILWKTSPKMIKMFVSSLILSLKIFIRILFFQQQKIDPLMYTHRLTLFWFVQKKKSKRVLHVLSQWGGESNCFGASVAVGSQLYSIFLQTVKAATK